MLTAGWILNTIFVCVGIGTTVRAAFRWLDRLAERSAAPHAPDIEGAASIRDEQWMG